MKLGHDRSIQQFQEWLREQEAEFWSSSETQPEEVLQQFERLENEVETEGSVAEELLQGRNISAEQIEPIRISHFVDGSPRTQNVGFVLGSNGISYPVALSHVDAASVSYENGRWQETGFTEKYLILFSFNRGFGVSKVPVQGKWQVEDPLDNLQNVDQTDISQMRAAAIRRARWRMRNCEKELVSLLANKHPEEWIALDGTLFEVEGHSYLKEVHVVGISKTFTLKPIVQKGSHLERMPMGQLSKIVRGLQVGCRSAVYKLTPQQGRLEKYTYMWFVRIHTARHTPISGVVKVELPPSDRFRDSIQELENVVDGISKAIFEMRTPYLYDNRRGESFLYPIYVAECLAKSKLSSVERLRGYWQSGLM